MKQMKIPFLPHIMLQETEGNRQTSLLVICKSVSNHEFLVANLHTTFVSNFFPFSSTGPTTTANAN